MVPRNQTINKVPERLVLAYCRTSFCHIHRHKAASRGRQELAVSRPLHCIKINDSYLETHLSAADSNLTLWMFIKGATSIL